MIVKAVFLTDQFQLFKETIQSIRSSLTFLEIDEKVEEPAKTDILFLLPDFLEEKSANFSHLKKQYSRQTLVIAIGENESEFRTACLENGVDIFWHWPMPVSEMIARLKNIIRILDQRVSFDGFEFNEGELKVFPETKEVFVNQQELRLTASEYQLLLIFVMHPRRIYGREELLVLSDNERGTSRSIDTHIKNLRKKINDCSPRENYIQTVHGCGYRFIL